MEPSLYDAGAGLPEDGKGSFPTEMAGSAMACEQFRQCTAVVNQQGTDLKEQISGGAAGCGERDMEGTQGSDKAEPGLWP